MEKVKFSKALLSSSAPCEAPMFRDLESLALQRRTRSLADATTTPVQVESLSPGRAKPLSGQSTRSNYCSEKRWEHFTRAP